MLPSDRGTATSDLAVGKIFQDRRQPGHQENPSDGASSQRPSEDPSPIPLEDPLDDSPALDRPVRVNFSEGV